MTVEFRREIRWRCPNCNVVDVTTGPRPGAHMHNCEGLSGLTAPLVEVGVDCKVVATPREDYVGDELVRRDGNGVPMMNVQTIRADGSNDCYVFAPTAQWKGTAS